jgi:hypothetical protein
MVCWLPYVENPSNPIPYATKFRNNPSKNHERKPKKVQEPSRTPPKKRGQQNLPKT